MEGIAILLLCIQALHSLREIETKLPHHQLAETEPCLEGIHAWRKRSYRLQSIKRHRSIYSYCSCCSTNEEGHCCRELLPWPRTALNEGLGRSTTQEKVSQTLRRRIIVMLEDTRTFKDE